MKANSLLDLSDQLEQSVSLAGHSVVAVQAGRRTASSGILWQPGVVVTADHVLKREDGIVVVLPDGSAAKAALAGRDAGTDLAVLRVDDAPPFAAWTDATDAKAGQVALVVGRSAETGVHASMGILSSVSGPTRTWRGGKLDRFVRLDVSLYPGTSGSAVVDASGKLIGMATAGLSRYSGLAVPGETIRRVVDRVLSGGAVSRGFLGIGLQAVPLPAGWRERLGIQQEAGLILLSVEPEGPAGAAGLFLGDILVSINGKPVQDTDDVLALLEPETVGTVMTARFLRGGEWREVPVTVGEKR